MDRHEKLTEAKLMAVENILLDLLDETDCHRSVDFYSKAKEILSAICNEEIKAELADHEASLEEASKNRPDADN